MSKEPTIIRTLHKRADIEKNRIIIPKLFVDNYGREFDMKILSNGTILLVPTQERK